LNKKGKNGEKKIPTSECRPRIEKPIWPHKLLATGMTSYRGNRLKTAPNSNFEFEKLKIGKSVGITSLSTGKPVPKPIDRPTRTWSKKDRKLKFFNFFLTFLISFVCNPYL
jgi:hypothetical protein